MSSGAVFSIRICHPGVLEMWDQQELSEPKPDLFVSIELKQKCANGS